MRRLAADLSLKFAERPPTGWFAAADGAVAVLVPRRAARRPAGPGRRPDRAPAHRRPNGPGRGKPRLVAAPGCEGRPWGRTEDGPGGGGRLGGRRNTG